jgi:hypothetical protein
MPKIEITKQAVFRGRIRKVEDSLDLDEASCEVLVNGGFAKYIGKVASPVVKMEKKIEEEIKKEPVVSIRPEPLPTEDVRDHVMRGGRIAAPLQEKKDEEPEFIVKKMKPKIKSKVKKHRKG